MKDMYNKDSLLVLWLCILHYYFDRMHITEKKKNTRGQISPFCTNLYLIMYPLDDNARPEFF